MFDRYAAFSAIDRQLACSRYPASSGHCAWRLASIAMENVRATVVVELLRCGSAGAKDRFVIARSRGSDPLLHPTFSRLIH